MQKDIEKTIARRVCSLIDSQINSGHYSTEFIINPKNWGKLVRSFTGILREFDVMDETIQPGNSIVSYIKQHILVHHFYEGSPLETKYQRAMVRFESSLSSYYDGQTAKEAFVIGYLQGIGFDDNPKQCFLYERMMSYFL